MPSSRGPAEAGGGLKWALFIFIFLFLVVTVLAVMQFMKNAQLASAAVAAQNDLSEVGNAAEITAAKALRQTHNTRTALSGVTADMRYMAELITGQQADDVELAGLRNFVAQTVDPTSSSPDSVFNTASSVLRAGMMLQGEQPPLVDPENSVTRGYLFSSEGQFIGLKKVLDDLTQEIVNLTQLAVSLSQTIESEKALFAEERDQLQGRINELEQALSQAAVSADTYKTDYDARMEQIQKQYVIIMEERDEQYQATQTQLEQTNNQLTALNQEADSMRTEIRQLRDRLKELQPDPDQERIAMQPDGRIISVIGRDNLAYINLAKNDHIYRGLTFEVYDSYIEMPRSGQGKASLEVIEILDNISKCRIVSSDATNPIMEGDLIANLVWSKDKKYSFCVAGEFDFDGDGEVDSLGRSRIISLIERWGGTTTSTLSVGTDFLVLGHLPVLPIRPSAEEIDSNTPAANAYRKAQKLRDDYDQVRSIASDLGVPTFNRERFLYFIGFYDQAGSDLNF